MEKTPPALGLGREQDEVVIGKVGAGGGTDPKDKVSYEQEGKTGHCCEGLTHKLHDLGKKCGMEDESLNSTMKECSKSDCDD